jgi:hypothetical protein
MSAKKLWIVFSIFVVTVFSQASFAQGLNWEGQTGALLTPFAYTTSAPASKFGKPEVAFHYLAAGNVIGNDYQFSVTEGFGNRFEVGLTQSLSSLGSIGSEGRTSGSGVYNPPSYLFGGGYTAIHGKFTVLPENSFKSKWVPAIAVGAIGRFGDQRVNWAATSEYAGTPTEKNGDFYIVATKTVTQVKALPFVLSFGEKLTNASILGIAGDAGNAGNGGQRWQGRLFGGAAIVVKGPVKSALIIGSEVLQEPRYVQPLGADARIPSTESYFVRVVPNLKGSPLQVDFAVVHAGGRIVNMPNNPEVGVVDINANSRFGMGVSYHF